MTRFRAETSRVRLRRRFRCTVSRRRFCVASFELPIEGGGRQQHPKRMQLRLAPGALSHLDARRASYRWEIEPLALGGPIHRQVFRGRDQSPSAERHRMPTLEDRLDDVGREVGQADEAGHVRAA